MADDPLRFTTMPLTLVARASVGLTFQVWQPPVIGWQPLTEIIRAASMDEASAAQRDYLARHGGVMAVIFDRPDWKRPDFGRPGRG